MRREKEGKREGKMGRRGRLQEGGEEKGRRRKLKGGEGERKGEDTTAGPAGAGGRGSLGHRGVNRGCRRQIRLGRKTHSHTVADGSVGVRDSKGLSCEWKPRKMKAGRKKRKSLFKGTLCPWDE